MLDRKVNKVSVQEHLVWWSELRVVLEVHSYFCLFQLSNLHSVERAHFVNRFLFLDILRLIVDFPAGSIYKAKLTSASLWG